MRWKITPFLGVGDLHLGMSPSQVASILGQEVHFTTPIKNGSFNEHREGKLPVCNYKDDILRSIDIYADIYDLEFDDLLLFQEEPRQAIRHLESVAGAPAITFGICFFKKIGVSLGKWINPQTFEIKARAAPEQDLRSISVSSKGAFFDMFLDKNIRTLRTSRAIPTFNYTSAVRRRRIEAPTDMTSSKF